jgi:hypothetical protein
MSFVATLLLRYEFKGFKMLSQQPVKIGAGVKKPKRDLNMVAKRREEWKTVTWNYLVGEEVDFA